VWVAAVFALLLATMRGARRTLVATAAVPLLAVVLLYAKNYVEFGVPSTSSWAGMNLAQVAYWAFPDSTRDSLIADGTLSPTAAIPAFGALDDYPRFVARTRRDTVPVLGRARKTSGDPNFNNRAYIAVSNQYLRDSLHLIEARPSIYLHGVSAGVKRFFQPSSADLFVEGNRAKIRSWDRLFNAVVLWRTPYLFHAGLSLFLAWLAAAAYGLALLLRLLRKRTRADARLVLLVYVWLTWAYVTAVVTLGEVSENQRVRFILDPLTLALVAAAGADLVRALRLRLPATRRLRRWRPARPEARRPARTGGLG
jgi:hypothetical protein